jgi:hypothetical protein
MAPVEQVGSRMQGCLVGLIFGFWKWAYKSQNHLHRCFWLLAFDCIFLHDDINQKPKSKAAMLLWLISQKPEISITKHPPSAWQKSQ